MKKSCFTEVSKQFLRQYYCSLLQYYYSICPVNAVYCTRKNCILLKYCTSLQNAVFWTGKHCILQKKLPFSCYKLQFFFHKGSMVSCKKSPLYLDWHLLMMSLMATRSFCGAYLSTILMRPGWETRRVRDLRALVLFQTQATHTTSHTFTERTNTTQIIVHFPNLTLQQALTATCLFSGCL